MTRLIKSFLWIGLLVFNLQYAWGFALLGPNGFGNDKYQTPTIGYDINIMINDLGSSKNLGEEYRRNTPMLYYSYDANFLDYFGSNGVVAVDQAVAIMNALTNVDNYDYTDTSEITNFPFDTRQYNGTAGAEYLRDLKSAALFTLVEQMGLADPVRYAWCLHDRTVLTGPQYTNPCPAGIEYTVIQRNFDPITWVPTNVINDVTYGYVIYESCVTAPEPESDALELVIGPGVEASPVAAGMGYENGLDFGVFYTGLTWDDVGGLKYLYRSNNILYEDLAPGSVPVAGNGSTSTNFNDEYTLVTSNLTVFILTSVTNNPTALQSLYPGLVVANVVTNFNDTFTYTFANVATNHFSTNTAYQVQVQKITIGPVTGAPIGSPPVTNTTTTTTIIHSNIVSGDFFLIPTNVCGLDIVQTQATNIISITNNLGSVTNVNGSHTIITSTNIVASSTNYTLVVAPCESLSGAAGTNSTTGLFQGVENIKFTKAYFDSLLGIYFQPITNTYNVVMVSGSKPVPLTFQRVVTKPDILFSAADLAAGDQAPDTTELVPPLNRSDMNFDENNVGSDLAGPGTINPSSTITFDKVGPAFINGGSEDTNPFIYFDTTQSPASPFFVWGSFDNSTNPIVTYPNGVDIQNLENEVLIQISPASLSDGTSGVPYTATFTATGGAFTTPYTWSAPGGLPPGLSIASNPDNTATISGIPTQSGTFGPFVIQMTDAATRSVQWEYSLTIH